ncbi:MAG TPA: BamA/TamA family outer membrane protein [Candidatus Limnocylindria bacterium]|nr:BamA/TamA family outer membrane protein [Candidatus Limnocylindria bacterium]
MPPRARLALLVAVLGSRAALAVQLEALEAGREWRLRALVFRGNHALRTGELRRALVTAERPWYQRWRVWRPAPDFDPVTFRADLERLRRFYRSRGYYHARVAHDLELEAGGDALTAVVSIEEGPPVVVEDVRLSLRGAALEPAERERLLGGLPLARGAVFGEDAYERAVAYLRAWYRERGFARVRVHKRAQVDVRQDRARVAYEAVSGPPSVFGEVRIAGTRAVDPEVVRRELAFHPGEPFKASLLERTRSNLTALRLFRSIRIDEDKGRDARVGVRIRVIEAPRHEVRFGVGYDTEEQLRGLAGWRDYDFLGGARQLGFTARASFLRRSIAADFLQPHFPGARQRLRLIASEDQEDEEAYTNDRARFTPRLEVQPLPTLTAYTFYRLEYDSLSDVNRVVARRFPDIAPHSGLLSGAGLGVDWNGTDDVLDPTRGWVTSASVEPVGGVLGGKFSFVRLQGEGRRYQPLVADLGAAFRFRLGTEALTGGSRDVPLFERLYAGGIGSVRGYERRHVGPLVDDDPIGGRSLVEGSAELRHPVTERLGAAVFADAGQVSLASFDFPFDDLRWGFGLGLRYKSPVGPLRVDLGFPLEPPRRDARWQIHLSVGQVF